MTEMVLARKAEDRTASRPINALAILVDVIEDLARARSVEDIAMVVRTAARSVCGADGVAVVVRDGDRCHYIDEDAIGPLWKGAKFPLSA